MALAPRHFLKSTSTAVTAFGDSGGRMSGGVLISQSSEQVSNEIESAFTASSARLVSSSCQLRF